MPTKAKIIKLYSGDRPLFNKFNLEEQIESIYKRRVPLPSGGEIVIDGTEALTAIDVNSARSKRHGDAEETPPRRTSRPRRRSPGSSGCATSAASSSSTSST